MAILIVLKLAWWLRAIRRFLVLIIGTLSNMLLRSPLFVYFLLWLPPVTGHFTSWILKMHFYMASSRKSSKTPQQPEKRR
ncbi:copia protein [Phtheirospermum japonicum]|uniref:Copia protein n=1 Tax=Phtheirospermum japonicum TaxID=374723 RepID=A0A830C2I3_9LAMI|nr:copia protein [Phtheirospermum japonicum]